MDAKKRIDKILTAAHEQVKEEIGVLLGVEFSLSDERNTLASKEEFLDGLIGKQILARVDLAGDLEGQGCLVIGIKDAIRLGGTLIMLPDAELEEVVGREEYAGETEDSYGEIANIIAGSYTKVFEESYSKSFRFIRKEQQVLVPANVDIASDDPFPDQQYYQVSCSMKMEGRQLGDIHMLLPAVAFGLQTEASADPVAQPETAEQSITENVEEKADESAPQDTQEKTSAAQDSIPVKAVDPEKQKKRIDKLLDLCEGKLTEELSALLGVEVKFSGITNRLVSKEDLFFDELEGRQIIADMELTGELQGKSYFFAGLKDSIRLGGILIMLPPAELDNVINDEEFGDDVKDAYGEVANIVSGVYTSVFEEQFTQKVRFVKNELQQVVPMKVDIASDEPIPDMQYYMSTLSLQAEGTALGNVRMLLPAKLFGLIQDESFAEDAETAKPQQDASPITSAATPDQATVPETVDNESEVKDAAPVREPGFNVEQHRKRVDKLLKECSKKTQEEVGALLGTEIRLDISENRLITKEDFFFDEANGKQVVADLEVVGELEDESYLFVSLKDAIHMGGVLIMLPPSELEIVIADEEFSEDTRDAYGEIANIISGVYTAVFEEQYSSKIRFVRKDIDLVVPMKVDIDSEEPIPDVEYYMSSMSLSIEGEAQGNISVLFPAKMLKLDTIDEPQAVAVADSSQGDGPGSQSAEGGMAGPQRVANEEYSAVDILVISDDESESSKLAEVAEKRGFSTRQLSFKDNIKGAITEELKAVYIVMQDVNEQAFGMAIKVSSSCSLPVIAAGPDWTRSKVIKAVKYGVSDILLTPATPEDIQENLENNLVQMAA